VRRATFLALALVACGGASRPALNAMSEMERVRSAPDAKEAESGAPQEFKQAERLRDEARAADASGDDTGAGLYAERAVATYEHALVLARLARAQTELDDATQALSKADEESRTLARSRADAERDADALDKQLKIAREMLLPAPSGPADPAREAARLVAARALATQAELLCGAAHLLSPSATGLADADQELAAVVKDLAASPRPVPIDRAARARARCLGTLTEARRANESDGQADALLSELSAAGGWDPTRDERGVVVMLRGVFRGASLAPEATDKLKELGRVAAAHPAFALQVVVHDAGPANQAATPADKDRADAAAKAIVAGGAPASRVQAQAVGTRAPVVDPGDAKLRERNERLEIVFVAPGN
jgi:flagellar motor protein MotB